MAIADGVPKEYVIAKVADFVKVPPDRIGQCLREFTAWISMVREVDEVSELLSTMAGAEGRLGIDRFIWRDDGKVGMSAINVVDKETGETAARVEFDL